MSFYQRIASLAVLAVTVACSASAFAHSDVLFGNDGGKVAIGTAEEIGTMDESLELFPAGTTGAFESIMVAGDPMFGDPDYESDEPGFYSDPTELGANAVPAGLNVSVATTTFTVGGMSADLFYWNGMGAVNFTPVTGTTTFEFEQDPITGIGTTTSGAFDDHPEFILEDSVGTPANGVYLIAPVVEIDTLTTSDPFYVVLLVDDLIDSLADAGAVEEAIEDFEEGLIPEPVALGKNFGFYEEAVEYVEENIVIPEPTTGLLAVMAFGLVTVSRKRTV